MDLAKALVPHVECPVCLVVPRDGVMLQCLIGHNVCSVCKNKLGADAKCPLGRCDFGTPPATNPTVASLVKSFPFEWPCKYASEAGCGFEGSGPSVAAHEAACRRQLPIPCPHHGCRETVSLGAVGEHLRTAHNITPKDNESGLDQGKHTFGWCYFYWMEFPGIGVLQRPDNSSWPEAMFSLGGCVEWVLLCCHYHNDIVYLWLWVPLDEEEAEKLECKIKVGNVEGFEYTRAVYPMGWDRQKVLSASNRPFCYQTWFLSQFSTHNGNQFEVSFHVYKRS